MTYFFPQLAINAEQKLEIDRLRRELDQTRMQAAHANTALQTKEMVAAWPSDLLAA